MCTFINFFGADIPSYGLCMAVGIFLCAFLSIKKATKLNVSLEDMIIFIAVLVGCIILGGGGLYIAVTYTPGEIWQHIKNFDFSFITNGGIVFYGGVIGGFIGAVICVKLLKLKMEIIEKSLVPYIPLGHAIGRVGCLLAGCCYGLEYSGFCAVPNNLLQGKTLFPIQGVEALVNVFIALFLLHYVKKERAKFETITAYIMIYAVSRFILEFFRGDKIRGGFLFFSTSQWISLGMLAAGVIFTIYKKVKK